MEGLLFYSQNSPVTCIYFLKSAGIRNFPLLGSPAGLGSISGHSELEHRLPTEKIPCPCSLLQTWGLQQQGTASAWCRNILHDLNKTIITFVKLQGQEQFNSFLKQANFLELLIPFFKKFIILLFMHGQALCYRYFLGLLCRITMCGGTQIIQLL